MPNCFARGAVDRGSADGGQPCVGVLVTAVRGRQFWDLFCALDEACCTKARSSCRHMVALRWQ